MNKVKYIIEKVDMLVFIQVNIGNESLKVGVSVDTLNAFWRHIVYFGLCVWSYDVDV